MAFSTEGNDRLLTSLPRDSGNVEVQNCLGAYHITPTATGAHVAFTQHVNAHPPLLSAATNFSLTWSKQVDNINAIRGQARALAQRSHLPPQSVVPGWMLDGAGHRCDSAPATLQLYALPAEVLGSDYSLLSRDFALLLGLVASVMLAFATGRGALHRAARWRSNAACSWASAGEDAEAGEVDVVKGLMQDKVSILG